MNNPQPPATVHADRAERAHELADYAVEIQTLIRNALTAAEQARAVFVGGESDEYVSANFVDLLGTLGLLNREASRTTDEWCRIASARDRH